MIKYIPSVGDSKRAMDEYTSEIFMGGKNTIVIHNTCEDSLLAAPLIMDLIILAEVFPLLFSLLQCIEACVRATKSDFAKNHLQNTFNAKL